MKSFSLFALLLALLVSSCSEDKAAPPVPLEDAIYTGQVDFAGGGRIFYEITGPDWDTPNVYMGETLLIMGQAYIDKGILLPETNEMAAYSSGATPVLTFHPLFEGLSEEETENLKEAEDGTPPEGTYAFRGLLIDSEGTEREVFNVQGDLTVNATDYAPVVVNLEPLPTETARIYTLAITHTYTIGQETFTRITHTEFAQVWRAPLPGTKLYQKIIRWGCQWLDNAFPDEGETSENELADILLLGMENLVPLGYRYGSLTRPVPYTNKAEVFLDYKQSACGEFYGFFMDLVETQGIDANYLIFWFPNPTPDWYSMYETIDLPALGRDSKVWRYADHGLVEVNGRVYDPTYLLIKENADEYEDYLFARFCYGDEGKCGAGNAWCLIPSGPQGICADNTPGYDEELGFIRSRGETY